MEECPKLNRVIVITAKRKVRGMGADKMGNKRQNATGKEGVISTADDEGKPVKELFRTFGTTFADLSSKLRKSGLIPPRVSIKAHDDTRY